MYGERLILQNGRRIYLHNKSADSTKVRVLHATVMPCKTGLHKSQTRESLVFWLYFPMLCPNQPVYYSIIAQISTCHFREPRNGKRIAFMLLSNIRNILNAWRS